MKAGVLSCAIVIYLSVTGFDAAPAGNTISASEQLEVCHQTYNDVIAHIAESEGEEATNTIWNLIFHYLDLDGNEAVTAPEIALYLEKEQYVHESDVMEVMHEAAEWIKAGGGDGEQLNFEEFFNVVGKTVAENSDSAGYIEIALNMCQLFTKKVPHIAESMTELETCTKHLDESIRSDETERAEFNSWFAIFETMDSNQDGKIDLEELKASIGHSLTTDDDVSIANALGHAIYGSVHHDLQDIEEKNFYIFVHELLYGLDSVSRKHSWGDVVDEHELRGRAMLCKAIYDVRKKIVSQRNLMGDCIKSYQNTRQRILGEDGVFAPEIVFTMADADRDGQISQHEFDVFIGAPSTFYGTVERKHASKTMKIDEFRSVMPDELVDTKKGNDVKATFELSSMTSQELDDAEKLCTAIIDSVHKYPHGSGTGGADGNPPLPESFKGMGHYTFHEYTLPEESTEPTSTPTPETEVLHITDHNGNPLEITITHHNGEGEEGSSPSPSTETFKGSGNDDEHTVPPETDTKLNPPTPVRPGDLTQGLTYHMTDADGNAVEIHLDQIEIDDILHRMAMAQNAPIEPTDNEQQQPPISPNNDDDGALMRELEKLIKAGMSEHQPQPTESSESEEEMELKKLLQDMERSN